MSPPATARQAAPEARAEGGGARSRELWARARRVIPGGVNSPVRAFGSVGGTPVFIRAARGAYVESVDGRRFLDVVGSFGPLILGHAPPEVLAAVAEAAAAGTSFGAATQREVELAERVTAMVPSVEAVRFVSSGTEAAMSAARLARGATGRSHLVKFAGCYHGHADTFLSDAGSGLATLGIPASAGVPEGAVADVITLPFNDVGRVEEVMGRLGDRVAAILVEPVPCNMGLVPPAPGFIAALRALCDRHGSLLVFDEVITGFRLGTDGAQGHLGIEPDITCFGKIIGGGLPVGAYGGRASIMGQVSPSGPVYQAGTLSGNPLAMAAGLATLAAIAAPGFFAGLAARGAHLAQQMAPHLARHRGRVGMAHLGSIFYLWFGDSRGGMPRDFAAVKSGHAATYARFFHGMLARGVMLAPSAFEVGFLSAAHQPADLDLFARAAGEALDEVLGAS